MRVIIAASGLGHINRGMEIWATELAYGLRRSNVSVYLFKGGGRRESYIEYVLPCLKRNSLTLAGKYNIIPNSLRLCIEEVTFSFPLTALAKMLDVDIIHITQLFPLLVLLKRKKWIRSQIIFMNPGSLPKIEHIYVQQPAPYYMEKAKELRIDTKNWFMIPSFVDTHKFSPIVKTHLRKKLGIPEDAFVILSVGAITKRHKRMDWLIREVAKLNSYSKRKVFLMLTGQRENETEEVVRLGKKLLRDHIIFLLNVPHERMPDVYISSDIFVLSSCPEAFGLAFLEAMASGKPAIGHNYPVTKWIIGDGGDVVDMTKEDELAKIIKRYVIDEDLRREKGEKARERVEKMFSLDKVIRRIIYMYNRISDENDSCCI